MNEYYFEVCEVHYNDKNEPQSWTDSKHLLSSEELGDIHFAYEEIQKAFDKPVLEAVNGNLVESSAETKILNKKINSR